VWQLLYCMQATLGKVDIKLSTYCPSFGLLMQLHHCFAATSHACTRLAWNKASCCTKLTVPPSAVKQGPTHVQSLLQFTVRSQVGRVKGQSQAADQDAHNQHPLKPAVADDPVER
jgi:hypothetical protein